MKLLFIATLVLLTLCSSCVRPAGDPTQPGGMSDNLVLTIGFEPRSEISNEHFKITLKNKSGNDLNVSVQPTRFHGTVTIAAIGKVTTEYYEKRFLNMVLTSTWTEPIQLLQKGATIVWNVPIADLVDVQEKGLATAGLEGASAYATLDLIAIVPPSSSYTASNAKQTSKTIALTLKPNR